MNQVQLARQLGALTSCGYRRAYSDWLINSLEPQPYTTFSSTVSKSFTEHKHVVAHNAGVNCLTIDSSDGRFLVSGGADASIYLWDLKTFRPRHDSSPAASLSKSTRGAHTHAITAVSIYPYDPTPSTLITASHDKSVKLISITPASLDPIHTFPLDYGPYTVSLSQLLSAPPLVAVGTAHPATRLLDLRSGLGTHSLPGHSGGVYSIAWSPKYDYILASGATDGRVLFFDIRRANAAFASLDLEDAVGVIGEDPLTGAGARRPLDWNARAHAGPVTGVQWTPEGDKIVSVGHDQRIRVWDVATGRNDLVHFGPRIRNEHTGTLMPLISPRGCTRPGKELLFWPNDDGKGDVYLHSLREGNLVRILSTPGVQRTDIHQGKQSSIGKLTSRGRINGLIWRKDAACGRGIELYSAHGDGRIWRWASADIESEIEYHDEEGDESEQLREQGQAKKRKRDMVGDLVASLSNKSTRL